MTLVYQYDGHHLAMVNEQGEPLFVLKDICDVARRLDEEGVDSIEVLDNRGVQQKTNVVTEAGLYEVIFMSRKPEAKAFRRWVAARPPGIRHRHALRVSSKSADGDTNCSQLLPFFHRTDSEPLTSESVFLIFLEGCRKVVSDNKGN